MDVDEQVNDVTVPILPGDVPVQMPELPVRLVVNTAQQLKALGDPLRLRVLNVIRHQPATAKQLADQLHASPGAMGHHLRVLHEAGLAQVVARRLQRGIVASYYTRTARIFDYDLPPELAEAPCVSLDILTQARDELAEALAHEHADLDTHIGFPHVRLTHERMAVYAERVHALITDFINEPSDSDGQVVGLCMALFTAPPYMQVVRSEQGSEPTRGDAT